MVFCYFIFLMDNIRSILLVNVYYFFKVTKIFSKKIFKKKFFKKIFKKFIYKFSHFMNYYTLVIFYVLFYILCGEFWWYFVYKW